MMSDKPKQPCADDAFLDEVIKPEANKHRRQRWSRFFRQCPVENMGIGTNERKSALEIRVGFLLNRRAKSQSPNQQRNGSIALRPGLRLSKNGGCGNRTNSLSTEKCHPPAAVERFHKGGQDSCPHKSSYANLKVADMPTTYKFNKTILPVNQNPEIPTNPTIQPEKRGKVNRRGSTGTISTIEPAAKDRRGSTGTLMKNLNSDCFPERCWSALDDQRPSKLGHSSSKTVLKALGVSDVESLILGVPEGRIRAADLFPAPTTILNPYEEDEKFINGLVFVAPMSEDAIRSMLGHPAKRFMPPSRGPRPSRRQSL